MSNGHHQYTSSRPSSTLVPTRSATAEQMYILSPGSMRATRESLFEDWHVASPTPSYLKGEKYFRMLHVE